jgi:hypothetical protein
MNEHFAAKVATLLLRFSDMSKTQQDAFLNGLSRYLFNTPEEREHLVEAWQRSLRTAA